MPLASELPLDVGVKFLGAQDIGAPESEFTVSHMPSGGEHFGKWMLIDHAGVIFPAEAILVSCNTASEIIENAKSTVNWDDY